MRERSYAFGALALFFAFAFFGFVLLLGAGAQMLTGYAVIIETETIDAEEVSAPKSPPENEGESSDTKRDIAPDMVEPDLLVPPPLDYTNKPITILEEPDPIERVKTCRINSITWKQNFVRIGEWAEFGVEAADDSCSDQGVEFDLYEEDIAGRSLVSSLVIAYFNGRNGIGRVFISEDAFSSHLSAFLELGEGEFRITTKDTEPGEGNSYATSKGRVSSNVLRVGPRGEPDGFDLETPHPIGDLGGPKIGQGSTKVPRIIYLDSFSFYNHQDTHLIIYGPGLRGTEDARFDRDAAVWVRSASGDSRHPAALTTWKDDRQINLFIPKGFAAGEYTARVINTDNAQSNEMTFTVYDLPSTGHPSIGMGCTSAFNIDRDCDGYGISSNDLPDHHAPVGTPDWIPLKGRDADDFNARVNTPATARAEYGGLDDANDFKQWIGDLTCLDTRGDEYQCYTHTMANMYFVSPNGDDNTGVANDPSKPYRTANKLRLTLRPGDVVVFREGFHRGFSLRDYQRTVKGTAAQPILYIVAPGERAVFASFYNTMSFSHGTLPNEGPQEYLIFDGLEINGRTLAHQERRTGIALEGDTKHITFRNMEVTRFGAQVLGSTEVAQEHMLFDSMVIHDAQDGQRQPEHGIYKNQAPLGREHDSFVVKDSIFNRLSRHALQLRPKYGNLTVTRNIFHTNAIRAIEIKGSTVNSEISNNLMFNNGVMPILINRENRRPYKGPIDNVSIFQNTIWIGNQPNGIGDSCWMSRTPGCRVHTPGGDNGIGFLSSGDEITMTNLKIANNVVITSGGALIRNQWLRNLETALIQKNFIYSTKRLNPTTDLAGMHSLCLRHPNDNTHDWSNTVGSCTQYAWSLNSLENKGNRPLVFNNALLPASELPKLFTDVSYSYILNPGSFDFNPAAASLATDNSHPTFTAKRDIRGNLRGTTQDAGAYEFTGGASCTNGQRRNCNNQAGVCRGAQSVCTSNRWPVCDENTYRSHSASYEHGRETSCSDSLDNDCDGLTDSADSDCASAFDFGISLSPTSGSAPVGGIAQTLVQVQRVSGEGPVTLLAPSLPPYVAANFVPYICVVNATSPFCGSALRLSVSASAPIGRESIVIRGRSGGVSRDTTYTLDITGGFNFSMALSPTSGTATPGGYNETTVTITKTVAGTTGVVNLQTIGLDTNLTAAFFPSRCVFRASQTNCVSRLRLNVGPLATLGPRTVEVSANGNSEERRANYDLEVVAGRSAGSPFLARIVPDTVSNQVETDVSFEGANFTELAALVVGTILLPVDNTIPINETLVRFLASKRLTPGTYPVSVLDIGFRQSNPVSMTVTDLPDTQKVLDTDLDGVPNARDKCPRTPGKYHVKARGGRSGCPLPDYGIFSRSLTSNFSDLGDLRSVGSLRLGLLNRAVISFTTNVSLVKLNPHYYRREAVDLASNINISQNKVMLDSANLPNFDVESEITFFGVNVTNPTLYQDGNVCGECTSVSYTEGNFVVKVPGWSEYEVRQGSCGDKYCSITESKANCPADCGSSNPGGNGGGGSGGGGGGGPTSVMLVDLDDGKQHEVEIKKGSKIDMKVEKKLYRVEVSNMEEGSAQLRFINITKDLEVKLGQLYLIDLQQDGREDIELHLEQEGDAHTLILKKVQGQGKDEGEQDRDEDEGEQDKTATKETPQTFNPSTTGFWVLLIGVLVIIAGIYLFLRDRKWK